MMPPYGTPPHPYVAMYPPGGMYAHPSMPPVLPLMFDMKWICIEMVAVNHIFNTCSILCQGSYPYSPYAMPSPNGMAEASVSLRPIIFHCVFLKWSLLPFLIVGS